MWQLLESVEFECTELSQASDKAARAAAREAVAQYEKESAAKLEQQQEEVGNTRHHGLNIRY